MNSVYFACMQCRILVDAGYRWATGTLERAGTVSRDAPVDVRRVLEAADYWRPDAGPEEHDPQTDDRLLNEVLPHVRTLLSEHSTHHIVFGDDERIMGLDDLAFLEWLELGSSPTVGPRFLAEVVGLDNWADAVRWIREQPSLPWWWTQQELVDEARVRFIRLAKGP